MFNKTEEITQPTYSISSEAIISATTEDKFNNVMTRNLETTTQSRNTTASIIETTTQNRTATATAFINETTTKMSNSSLIEKWRKRRNEKKKVRRALCHEIPRGTGLMTLPLPVNASKIVRSVINPGGHFKFEGCKARQRIAVIVTSRYRENINETFFLHIHLFLMQQETEYNIFVIGQNNTRQTYSKGRLFNIGFLEVQRRLKTVSCFIFHDANILPLDSRNLYRCTWYPRQLAVALVNSNKQTFKLKFGCAIALTAEQFHNINGFSNQQRAHHIDYTYLKERLLAENYMIARSPAVHGKYLFVKNKVKIPRRRPRQTTKYPPMFDGLSTLAYTVACFETRALYTYISVIFPEEFLADTTQNKFM